MTVTEILLLANGLTMLVTELSRAGRNEVSDDELFAMLAKNDALDAKIRATLQRKLAALKE